MFHCRLKTYCRQHKETMSPYGWAMFYVHRILRYFLWFLNVMSFLRSASTLLTHNELTDYYRLSPAFYILVIFYSFVLRQLYKDTPLSMNAIVTTDYCRLVSSWLLLTSRRWGQCIHEGCLIRGYECGKYLIITSFQYILVGRAAVPPELGRPSKSGNRFFSKLCVSLHSCGQTFVMKHTLIPIFIFTNCSV